MGNGKKSGSGAWTAFAKWGPNFIEKSENKRKTNRTQFNPAIEEGSPIEV